MTSRLFVTLLALLTGLSACIGPAQARVSGTRGAETSAIATLAAQRPAQAPIRQIRQSAEAAQRTDARLRGQVRPAFFNEPVGVRIGIDRSRE